MMLLPIQTIRHRLTDRNGRILTLHFPLMADLPCIRVIAKGGAKSIRLRFRAIQETKSLHAMGRVNFLYMQISNGVEFVKLSGL